MKLTKIELAWLHDIVEESVITMTAQELRSYKLYLAKAIIASRVI